MKCTVLGAGAWGTTFGQVMADAGNDVTMWAIEPEIVEGIRDRHHNAVRLPSVAKLPDNMTATATGRRPSRTPISSSSPSPPSSRAWRSPSSRT